MYVPPAAGVGGPPSLMPRMLTATQTGKGGSAGRRCARRSELSHCLLAGPGKHATTSRRVGDPSRRYFSPEIETMPRAEIEREREEKLLGDLLPWAYERSALIREIWDAAGVSHRRHQDDGRLPREGPVHDKDAVRSYRDRHDDPNGGLLCLDPPTR